ncbi:MAG: hypothetical protein ABIQ02_06020 [Saprospiraceae bacterium]
MRNLNIVIDQISRSIIRKGLPCLAVIFLFFGCKEGDNYAQDQLIGRWEITKAERNGRETNYLRRGYFLFDQGVMTINITGADERGPYTLKDNKIVMGKMNFELKTVKNDSMIVTYLAGPNSEYIFHMLKTHENVQ